MKFNIGDRVKVTNADCYCFSAYRQFMSKYAPSFLPHWQEHRVVKQGSVGVVVARGRHLGLNRNLCVVQLGNQEVYVMDEKGLVLVSPRHTQSSKILITTDGKTTLARLYEGDKVVRSAEAKCNPVDEFNFNTGARLAFERLLIGEKATEFDWGGYKAKKFVVHCDTEQKAKAFLRECHNRGMKWVTGLSFLAYSFWSAYEENTCYSSDGTYSDIGHFHRNNIKVVKCPFIEETKYWTGKVVCVEANAEYWGGDLIVGKVYRVEDGQFVWEKGRTSLRAYTDVPGKKEEFTYAKFIEFKE